jgi:hypothetical protein
MRLSLNPKDSVDNVKRDLELRWLDCWIWYEETAYRLRGIEKIGRSNNPLKAITLFLESSNLEQRVLEDAVDGFFFPELGYFLVENSLLYIVRRSTRNENSRFKRGFHISSVRFDYNPLNSKRYFNFQIANEVFRGRLFSFEEGIEMIHNYRCDGVPLSRDIAMSVCEKNRILLKFKESPIGVYMEDSQTFRLFTHIYCDDLDLLGVPYKLVNHLNIKAPLNFEIPRRLNIRENNVIRYVGLEIEVEFNPRHTPSELTDIDYIKKFWRLEGDGSIRNGIEFISKEPTLPSKVVDDLERLDHFLNETNKSETIISDRCSVHVHVDFRTWNMSSLSKYIIKYMAFEPLLFELVEINRRKNSFCKPLTNTEFSNSKKSITEMETSIFRGFEKYTALNSSRLLDIGTLEFRHHHGTSSSSEIIRWIDTILTVDMYCITLDYYQILSLKPEETVSAIVGDAYPDKDKKVLIEALGKGIKNLNRFMIRNHLFDYKINRGKTYDYEGFFKGDKPL